LESDVQPGAFGLLEPAADKIVPRAEVDLVIVPGVVFGRDKHRIGRGKGYYDRYLNGLSALKVGFCFSFNLEDAVPFEAHDVPVDVVITDMEIIE
jgi:5-formyltetrahydrofolate cyclo-ligase